MGATEMQNLLMATCPTQITNSRCTINSSHAKRSLVPALYKQSRNRSTFVSCAYTKRVWSAIANWARDTNLTPTQWTALGSILDWWMEIRLIEQASNRKGQESLIILTLWQIWKERNRRIFQHQRNEVPETVAIIKEEARAWIT